MIMWSGGLDPKREARDKCKDIFPILKISKFDIGIIQMLFCCVAIVEPSVLKRKIWSRCIDCLVEILSMILPCAFWKSYAVTWASITAYKLVEYLVNIHLILFKNVDVVINVHFMVSKSDIFLVCNLFVVQNSDLKSKNMRDFV